MGGTLRKLNTKGETVFHDTERGRVPHFLKATKSDSLPAQVACLGYSQPHFRHDLAPLAALQFGRTIDPIAAVSVSITRYEQGNPRPAKESTTLQAAKVWETLDDAMRSGSTTTLFTVNAYQAAVGLGLFDRIDAGELLLWGYDPSASGVPGEIRRRPWKGLCICDNPPTIVIVRHAERQGTLKILDLRNYGVKGWESLKDMTSGKD